MDYLFSFLREAYPESSNCSENYAINFDKPLACTSFFNDRISMIKVVVQQDYSPGLQPVGGVREYTIFNKKLLTTVIDPSVEKISFHG